MTNKIMISIDSEGLESSKLVSVYRDCFNMNPLSVMSLRRDNVSVYDIISEHKDEALNLEKLIEFSSKLGIELSKIKLLSITESKDYRFAFPHIHDDILLVMDEYISLEDDEYEYIKECMEGIIDSVLYFDYSSYNDNIATIISELLEEREQEEA